MIETVRTYLSFVRFSHSVFALPFALTGALLASRQHPVTLRHVFWIVVCMVTARSAAMGFNRLVDARFDAATAGRLLAAFTRLFGGGLEAPEARLSELPLLSIEERDHLLAWSGAGKRLVTSGALLHERFERWAAAEPERPMT